MFKKKRSFVAVPVKEMAMRTEDGNERWSGKGQIIKDMADHVIECHDEIDRLEALQPKENPKVDVVGYSHLHSLPNGVYEFSAPGRTAITLLKTGDGLYLDGKLSGLFTFDYVSRNYSHYQPLYEFPKEKKEYVVEGFIVGKAKRRVVATSLEEAQEISDKNFLHTEWNGAKFQRGLSINPDSLPTYSIDDFDDADPFAE